MMLLLDFVLFLLLGQGSSQSLLPTNLTVCPSCPVEYSCVLTVKFRANAWRFSGSFTCLALTSQLSIPNSCAGAVSNQDCGTFSVMNGDEVNGACLTSNLTGIATPELNGTSIECFTADLVGDLVQSAGIVTLLVAGPPSTPTFHSPVCTPTVNSTSVGVAVSWSEPLDDGGAAVDSYTLTAQGPVGDCTPESPCELTSLERERDFVLEVGESYTFTVSATNCQSSSCGEAQTGEDAEIRVHPATDLKLEVCPVYGSDDELKQAVASWTTLCPMLISPGDIPCVSVNQYQYWLQLSPGSDPGLTVDCTTCGACGCQCSGSLVVTDQLQEADIITVALTASEGGVPFQIAGTTIGSANNILQVDFMPYVLFDTVEVTCTFLDGFTGSDAAGCRISYGTDQQSLLNTVSSGQREEGRDSVQFNLTLSCNRLYYYEVTVDEGAGDCVGVKVEGTYALPGSSELSTGAAVAITAVIIFIVAFLLGALTASLVCLCYNPRRLKAPQTSTGTSGTTSALPPGPVYEELRADQMEMKGDVA